MSDLSKFLPGQQHSGDLTFKAIQEPWTTYQLEDGSLVRVRLNLVRVTQVGYLDNGLPNLNCQFAQIMDYVPTDVVKADAERRARQGEG